MFHYYKKIDCVKNNSNDQKIADISRRYELWAYIFRVVKCADKADHFEHFWKTPTAFFCG